MKSSGQEKEANILQRIDQKELVNLAVAIGNITAPSGYRGIRVTNLGNCY